MSPVVVTDPAASLGAYLAATIGGLLAVAPAGHGMSGPAIFRPSLPEWMDTFMPVACVVVRPAGGYKLFGTGRLPVADPVLDLICYGGSDQQAGQIALAAAQALKQLQQSTWRGATLYWARISGGPVPLPDPATLWPATFLSAQVMHSEAAQG